MNTVVYCFPAGWIWSTNGFLRSLGVVDIAGSGAVHLVGGSSAFVAAKMIGPRLGRWDIPGDPPMGSPANAVIGLFMLWWGWLAFNAGSTFGISGRKWILAAKSVVTTLVSASAGCIFAIFHSLYDTDGKIDILMIINGILGALVGVTAACAIGKFNSFHFDENSHKNSETPFNGNFLSFFVVTTVESVFIGFVGAWLANITAKLLIYLKVDDAVGATCVHGFGGLWGMIVVGLFGQKDELEGFSHYDGLFHGGGFYLLGVQLLASLCCMVWASILTFILIWGIDKIIPFRLTEHEELLGADYTEHNIHHPRVGVTRAVSVLKRHDDNVDLDLIPVGKNQGHMDYLERNFGDELFERLDAIRRNGTLPPE